MSVENPNYPLQLREILIEMSNNNNYNASNRSKSLIIKHVNKIKEMYSNGFRHSYPFITKFLIEIIENNDNNVSQKKLNVLYKI